MNTEDPDKNIRKETEDNYELPPGIILPEDDSSEYPDWRKGVISGIMAGIFGAIVLWLLWLGKIIKAENGITVVIIGFIIFSVMAGSIVAFRPPKK